MGPTTPVSERSAGGSRSGTAACAATSDRTPCCTSVASSPPWAMPWRVQASPSATSSAEVTGDRGRTPRSLPQPGAEPSHWVLHFDRHNHLGKIYCGGEDGGTFG